MARTPEDCSREIRPLIPVCLKVEKNQKHFETLHWKSISDFWSALKKAEEEFPMAERSQLWNSLASQQDKRRMVKFLYDCTLKNVHVWHMAEKVQALLSEHSEWEAAFAEVKDQPPYNSVVMTRQKYHDPVEAFCDRPKRPIPFILEVLAEVGVGFPISAYTQKCSCDGRKKLLTEGAFLVAIALSFYLFICCKRDGFFNWLARGDYGFGDSFRDLPWTFRPSMGFQPPAFVKDQVFEDEGSQPTPKKKKPKAKAEKAVALNKAEEAEHKEKEVPLTCASFGFWWQVPALAPKATITEASVSAEKRLVMNCSEWKWKDLPADVTAPTENPGGGTFDGNHFFFERPGGRRAVWVKLGCWRISVLIKFFTAVAVAGITEVIAARWYDPDICNALPLRSVFLLDASLEESSFDQQKSATWEIIDEMAKSHKDSFYVGLGQFGTFGYIDAPITNKLPDIKDLLPNITQRCANFPNDNCTASFRSALEECNTMLGNHKIAQKSYDVAVLLTQGEDSSGLMKPDEVLDKTQFVGVYAGDSEYARDRLRRFSCGNETKSDCQFFFQAQNFSMLIGQAAMIASDITSFTTKKTSLERPRECEDCSSSFKTMILTIPFILWWLYLLLPICNRKRDEDNEIEIGTPKQQAV